MSFATGMMQWFVWHWQQLLWSIGFMALAIVIAIVVHWVAFWVLRRISNRKHGLLGRSLVQHSECPTRWIFPLLAVLCVLPGLPLTPKLMSALEHITGLGLIASIAWLAVLVVEVTSDVVSNRYRIDVEDNLAARRIQTQFQMVRRVAIFLVTVITVAVMLMTFPAIKHIGTSILASAGVASLIVGVSMKDTLANLIAGVQIAFAQPFKIGDAVVVEKEWGWIEEIGMMYVVVRIWDLRRLVLPLSYFLTNAFENWTRSSADLLGTVLIYTDYTVPIEPLRTELRRICESTKLWKGEVSVLQVTDACQSTMQLRALVDARNAGDLSDLRCLVREQMIDFIQKNYPASLPRYRGEFDMATEGKPMLVGQSGPAEQRLVSGEPTTKSQPDSLRRSA